MDDHEIGEQIRHAAERAVADIPRQGPTPEFYARVGRPTHMPRRYAAYAVAAAAAVVAIVFGVVVLQNPDQTSVDTVAPPAPRSDVTAPTVPEILDPVAIQLAADAEIAAGLGLTIGEVAFDEDGLLSARQPDLTPFLVDGELLGYTKPAEVLAAGSESHTVYGPDGTTVRGVVDGPNGFVPVDGDAPPTTAD